MGGLYMDNIWILLIHQDISKDSFNCKDDFHFLQSIEKPFFDFLKDEVITVCGVGVRSE